jgi:hypothetical protein
MMGRFLASLLIVVAACGDNLEPGQTPGPNGTNTGPDLNPLPHTYPEICGYAQWTTVIAADPMMQVSVVKRLYGADVLAVPRAGGTLTGFAIDDRMDMMTDPNGTKIDVNSEAFTAVSSAVVANRLVATAVDIDAVKVTLLQDDLTSPQEIAKLPGTFMAQPAFLHADGQTMIPVGGPDGLEMTQFDAAWNPIATKLVGPSKPVSGMAATQYGDTVLGVWSTVSGECYVESLPALVQGPQSKVSFPCDAPRIAGDISAGTAKIVFEADGTVRLMHVAHTQMGGDSVLLRPDARSPRVVFDGSRYWISYIDGRGDVAVGFLDGNNELVSVGLIGSRPSHDAYELVMVDNHPWVFAVDPTNGYTAHRMCLTTSWQ